MNMSLNSLLHVSQHFYFCISFLVSLSKIKFVFSYNWLFIWHAFLGLDRTFSHSLCLYSTHGYFYCHQMNNAWIMNSYILFIADGFSGLLRHVSNFSIKDSVPARMKMELSYNFFRGYNLIYLYLFQAYLSNNYNDFYIYFHLI